MFGFVRGLAEQDFHKEFRVDFWMIAIESDRIHHILRSEKISFIGMKS